MSLSVRDLRARITSTAVADLVSDGIIEEDASGALVVLKTLRGAA